MKYEAKLENGMLAHVSNEGVEFNIGDGKFNLLASIFSFPNLSVCEIIKYVRFDQAIFVLP